MYSKTFVEQKIVTKLAVLWVRSARHSETCLDCEIQVKCLFCRISSSFNILHHLFNWIKKKMLNFFFNTHCMFNSPPIFTHLIWEMHEFMAKFQKEFIFLPSNLYVPTQYYLFSFFLRNLLISMYIRVMDSIYISQNAILTGFLMGISTLFDNFLDYL